MEHEQRGDTLDVAQEVWKSPSTGVIKVNWDVAGDKLNQCVCVSIIVWDHESYILVARSTTKPAILEPVAAKALAALHTVEFSRDLGLQKILLEGDTVQIVNVKANEK